MLAAYEAAIGPALRAIAGVVVPPSEKGKRGPKKTKVDKKSSQGKGMPPPRQTIRADNGYRSHHVNSRSTTEHRGQFEQAASSDPASFFTLPQVNHAPPPPQTVHDPAAFERLETQALRRRKVEALESLAHTTALLLAEFMDFRKGQAAAAPSSSTPNGTGGPLPHVGPGAGAAYAAAAVGMAANLIRPPAGVDSGDGQHDGAGEEQSGRPGDDESSASDSDDGDIPARVGQGDADEEDDSGTTSEDSGHYEMGPEADEEGLDVKVEND